jgi:hypothetical protein
VNSLEFLDRFEFVSFGIFDEVTLVQDNKLEIELFEQSILLFDHTVTCDK